MLVDEMGSAAAAALRHRRRTSLVWMLAGLFITVAVIALVVRARGGGDDQYNPSGLGALVIAGPIMFWYGAVVGRRGVNAFRSPGVERELRPLTATGRQRRRGIGAQPREDIAFAWLVGHMPGEEAGHDLGVPVKPAVVADVEVSTTPVVRGEWASGGHVVLEYPDHVVFPIGPVREIPTGLPRHVAYWRVVGLDEHEPFWNKFERK